MRRNHRRTRGQVHETTAPAARYALQEDEDAVDRMFVSGGGRGKGHGLANPDVARADEAVWRVGTPPITINGYRAHDGAEACRWASNGAMAENDKE
jgi:hypothetical protein